jgi:hypothetical protein
MFKWFKRLFRRKADALSKAEEQDVAVSLREIGEGKAKRFTDADALIADLKSDEGRAKQQLRQDAQEAVDRIERREESAFRPHSVDDLRKLTQLRRIAKQNEERQKATLGYGLKSRNFAPRPSYEKRLYKLDKKPPKKLEEED